MDIIKYHEYYFLYAISVDIYKSSIVVVAAQYMEDQLHGDDLN